jgi:malonyl-CoA/methylmalonyl-CoA synthetase
VVPQRASTWNREAWRRHLPQDVDLEGLDLLAEGSLARAWAARWRERPDEVALVDLAAENEALTRADLNRRTAALAAALSRLGLKRGQTMLMSARASVSLVLLHIAALRLGAVVLPVNTAFRQRELDYIVNDCRPSMALVDDAVRANWVQLAAGSETPLTIVDPSDPELLATDDGQGVPLDAAASDDAALLVYTSGTTGAPKGAILSNGNLLAASEALRLAWQWTADDGLVLALPLFHVHGLAVGVHTCLLAGARILLLPRFEPTAVLRACARPDATMFFGVPTMWVRIVDALADDPAGTAALRSLRLLVSGSAPLAPGIFEALEAAIGKRVLERYGMSETITLISNPYDGERRAGSVGWPLPGVEVRIVAHGRDAEREEVGEIMVRGPNVFAGYLNREEATREALDPDRWFRTGDLAWRSADDYVTIVGRAKELIVTGGYNVYPREVEDVLNEHLDVAEAAVVGVPSREWGEEVVAFVVAQVQEGPPAEESLAAWCRQRLANYKCPRRFTFVETIPRNAMGKIVRTRLSDR